MVIVIVAGVWYVFWRPSPNDSDLLPCETCPIVTECNFYASLSSSQEYPSPVIKLDNQKDSERYRIGDILVDKSRAAIEFTGSVANDAAQTVQFLISPQLTSISIESLITTEIKLVDLQNAIALLDWRYWEQLRTTNDAPLKLLVQWDENGGAKSVKAADVVREQRLKLGDLIFLGTEIQWQEVAMGQPGLPSVCPGKSRGNQEL